jgi:putative MATE family efflux protein
MKNKRYDAVETQLIEPPCIDSNNVDEEEAPSTTRKILSLALPALISLSIDPLMTIADTAFVGRHSTDPYQLAGLGSSASLLVFCFYVFNFLATATAPLVANRRAGGEEAGAVRVGGQALTLAILLGTCLTIGLLVYKVPLLKIMGTGVTGPQADYYAQQFLSVRALASPAVLICSASNGILRGYLDTATPTLILVASNLINLALDVVLVTNLNMGPLGAGIATTVAEWIAALAFLGVLAGQLPSANTSSTKEGMSIVPTFELPEWNEIKPLVVASSSVFLRSIVLQIAMSSAAAMAARSTSIMDGMGVSGAASSSVAAHQIALQLWLLCSFLCDALATASQALVADGIGRGDSYVVKSVSKTVFQWGLALGLSLSSMLWIGTESGFLVDFFTGDEGTKMELGKLLAIVIFAQPLNSFVFAADGVLQGAEEFLYQAKSMALSVVTAMGVFAVLEYTYFGQEAILPGGGDTLVHVWYGLIALQSMRGLTSFVKLVDERGPIDIFGKQIMADDR